MNWLAHLFLSPAQIDFQLGNLLADLVKVEVLASINQQALAGAILHRKIDSFTDSHPLVSQSKARLAKKGYLKGVVIDIAYDHLLAKQWTHYSSLPLEQFIQQFQQAALSVKHNYPEAAQGFIQGLIEHQVLASYQTREGVYAALTRLDKRLPARVQTKEMTSHYIPMLEKSFPALEDDFQSFFPELCQFAAEQLPTAKPNYWLI